MESEIRDYENINYSLDSGKIFNESWQLYSRLIGIGALAVLLYGVAAYLAGSVFQIVTGMNAMINEFTRDIIEGGDPESAFAMVSEFYSHNLLSLTITRLGTDLIMLLAFPLAGGFMLACREMDSTGVAGINTLFTGFKPQYWSRLMALAGIYYVVSKIAIIFFIIPGIYVWVAAVIACPLVVFADKSGLDALKTSFKLINKNWFIAFQILFVASLFGIAGYFLCYIGRIITYPFVLVTVYMLYKHIVGFPDDEISKIGEE